MKKLISVIFLLSACTKADAPPSTDTIAVSDSAEVTASWTVSPRGIGRIAAGMTLEEANAAVGNSLVVPDTLQECDWVRVKDGPAGVLFMVERGTITRVNIDDSST